LVQALAWANLVDARSLPGRHHKAFSQLVDGLTKKQLAELKAGFSLYAKGWVTAPSSTKVRDGLGPHFNAVSCVSCHQHNGRGRPPVKEMGPDFSLLIRLSVPGNNKNGAPTGEPIYGGQFHPRATLGVANEGDLNLQYTSKEVIFPDGEKVELQVPKYNLVNLKYGPMNKETMISPRVAPHLAGVGYLDKVTEDQILSYADENDKDNDGISGRANYAWNVLENKATIGKFGWKANQPTLLQQNAGAFNGDLGITSPLFPEQNCSVEQEDCYFALHGGETEISRKHLDFVNLMVGSIDAPRVKRLKNFEEGKKLFHKVDCQKCHRPSFEVDGKTVSPYTDLLLHDMGDELADNRPDFLANGKEWKTPPLWGVGAQKEVNGHTYLLHDGRARNVKEAILWHGGEAKGSKDKFMQLTRKEREALINFVNSI
jgi:CxxC motif-containing protein (DUF1111 family)